MCNFVRYTAKPLSGNWKNTGNQGGKGSQRSKACKLCKDYFSERVPRREAGEGGTAATCAWCFNAQRKKDCRSDMDLVMPDGSPREALVAEVSLKNQLFMFNAQV